MATFVRSALRIPIRYPFYFGVVFSSTKNGLADVLVQRYVEGVDEIDWRRASIFASFGAIFCGMWQFALFNKIMPALCPGAAGFAAKSFRAKLADKRGLKDLAIQVGLENGINNPILYFPIFYGVKYSLENDDFNPLTALKAGTVRYTKTFKEDVLAIWKVWVPVQTLNFAVMPLWARIPFTTMVSFAFTCYVSVMRGAPDSTTEVTDDVTGSSDIEEKITENQP